MYFPEVFWSTSSFGVFQQGSLGCLVLPRPGLCRFSSSRAALCATTPPCIRTHNNNNNAADCLPLKADRWAGRAQKHTEDLNSWGAHSVLAMSATSVWLLISWASPQLTRVYVLSQENVDSYTFSKIKKLKLKSGVQQWGRQHADCGCREKWCSCQGFVSQ